MLTNWDDKTECTYFPLDAINNELGNRNFLDFCTQHPFCSCQHLKGVGKGFSENTFLQITNESLSSHLKSMITFIQRCFWVFSSQAKEGIYRAALSSNTSHLEAHSGFFRLLMKGSFYHYVLWPFVSSVHVSSLIYLYQKKQL